MLTVIKLCLKCLAMTSKEEFLSVDIEKDLYVHPHDRERFQREIEEKGYVKDYEISFKKKTGEEISGFVTCNALLDKKGDIVGYQGLNIDITGKEWKEKFKRQISSFPK